MRFCTISTLRRDSSKYKYKINLKSLRIKFEMLREIVQDKLDILLISETRVDPSFPSR